MRISDKTKECLAGRVFRQRTIDKIKGIVIHRNEVGPGAVEQAAAFRDNPVYSQVTGGQPPYHFVIRTSGDIEQALPLLTIGAHVKGFNTPTIGVCCIGDFRTAPPTPAQWTAAQALTELLIFKFGLTQDDVKGHDEYPGVKDYKECPGRHFDMVEFRQDLYLKIVM